MGKYVWAKMGENCDDNIDLSDRKNTAKYEILY
jgi:hypothetical protein